MLEATSHDDPVRARLDIRFEDPLPMWFGSEKVETLFDSHRRSSVRGENPTNGHRPLSREG